MSATPPAERPPIDFSARLPTEADREIGTRIVALRKAAGISQKALAETLGVSYPQLQKYESGANRVSAGRLHLIAKAIGTTVGTLVGEEGARPVDSETLALLAEPGAVEHLRSFLALKSEHRSLVARVARDLRGAQAEAA